MKIIITTLLAVLALLYPVLVYWGMQHFSLQYIAIALIVLILLRLSFSRSLWQKMPWLKPASILGVVVLTYSALKGDSIGMLFYPVVVSTVTLIIFVYSLIKSPTIIETFARMTDPELDANGVSYCRNVTKIWCVFFIINGAIASYTALFCSLEEWALYNGFISYILMGSLMGIEYMVRLLVKKKQIKKRNSCV
ncbi:hypothetical protein ACOYR1_17540 [Thalassotalea piscium]